MAEFDTAKYIDKEITPKEYQEDIHRNKIHCPECEMAPLHIVNRQKGAPFFKSNRQDEHKPDCQHYRDFISNRELNRIAKRLNFEDKERLDFLVGSNLLSSIRLQRRNTNLTGSANELVKLTGLEKKTSLRNSRNFKLEHIPRVHI